jgi:hypothetical protein
MTSNIQQLEEGGRRFDFSNARNAEKLDAPGKRIPHGMSFVDFVVETDEETWLIEVKDPPKNAIAASEREKFLSSLQGDALINQHLVPKCRDSYTFLHLMRRDERPFLYFVLLGLGSEAALMLGLKDRLLKRLRQESDMPWARRYVRDCIVVNIDDERIQLPFRISRAVPK